jgi:hypothetical protein
MATAAALIEFGGALIVAYAVLRALLAIGARAPIAEARLIVIGGVLGALGFKTAATLLKTLQMGSWDVVGRFAAILLLRILVKQLFVWEKSRLALTRPRTCP